MAHLESLIVFDPEERSREALTFGFTREGFKVYATGDASDAVSMARTKVPQLVVCAVPSGREPAAEALDLIGTLREEGATRELPVVALGERNAREQSLRAGADEFVAKPAFIRDVLTLASLAVALRQDGDEAGVAGMLSDYELYFLTRALSTAERTGVLEIERGTRSGEVHFVKGEVVHARCGKMSGLAAFHHLLLWTEAQIHLRMTSPAGERKIHLPIDRLLAEGAQFAREFEAVASRIGGTQAVYKQEVRRAAEVRAQIPPEVMKILKVYDGKRALIDLVEDSPFKPLDTIKITFRLQELGVIERLTVAPDGTPLTAELAVRDWLLGSHKGDNKSSVTEAGRRAAEAFAEETERRAKVPPPELDILDDTAKVRMLAETAAQAESKTGKKKRARKREPTGRTKTAPASPPSPPADVDYTVLTPKVDLQPSQPPARVAAPDIGDQTIPFSKMPLERNDAAGTIDSAAPLPSKKRKPAPAPAAAKPATPRANVSAKANPNANVNANANANVNANANANANASTRPAPSLNDLFAPKPAPAAAPQPQFPAAPPAHVPPPVHAHAPVPPPPVHGHAPVPPPPVHAHPHVPPPPVNAQPLVPPPPVHAHAPVPPPPVQHAPMPHPPVAAPAPPFAAPRPAHAPVPPQVHAHAPVPPPVQHAPVLQPPVAAPAPPPVAAPRPQAQPQPPQVSRPNTNGVARPAKHAPAAKGTPKSAPVREPTAPFSKAEEQFFKEGVELANQEPVVDRFEDLEPVEPTSPKRRWWNLSGKKFNHPAPKSPKKR